MFLLLVSGPLRGKEWESTLTGTPIKYITDLHLNTTTTLLTSEIFSTLNSLCTPYKRPMTKEGFFKKYEYVYDEYYDCCLCTNNQILKYSTTNKNGYREYKSEPNICKSCPYQAQCTESNNCQKVVIRHVWKNYIELAGDVRHSDKGKEIYRLRKETIERMFANAKIKHELRYTQFKGLARLKMQVLLTFACMNLKKLASWKRMVLPSVLTDIFRLF